MDWKPPMPVYLEFDIDAMKLKWSVVLDASSRTADLFENIIISICNFTKKIFVPWNLSSNPWTFFENLEISSRGTNKLHKLHFFCLIQNVSNLLFFGNIWVFSNILFAFFDEVKSLQKKKKPLHFFYIFCPSDSVWANSQAICSVQCNWKLIITHFGPALHEQSR